MLHKILSSTRDFYNSIFFTSFTFKMMMAIARRTGDPSTRPPAKARAAACDRPQRA